MAIGRLVSAIRRRGELIERLEVDKTGVNAINARFAYPAPAGASFPCADPAAIYQVWALCSAGLA